MTFDFFFQFSIWCYTDGNQKPQDMGQGYILIYRVKHLACRAKISVDYFEFCSYFSQKIGFDISCKLSPQDVKAFFFSEKNK